MVNFDMPVSEAAASAFPEVWSQDPEVWPRNSEAWNRKPEVASWGHNLPPPPYPHRRVRVSKGDHCLPASRICAPHEPPETSQIRDSGSGAKIIRKCTTSLLGCPVGFPGGALSQKTGHFTAPRCLLPHLCGCRAKNETHNSESFMLR
jgi:hypothetical protein